MYRAHCQICRGHESLSASRLSDYSLMIFHHAQSASISISRQSGLCEHNPYILTRCTQTVFKILKFVIYRELFMVLHDIYSYTMQISSKTGLQLDILYIEETSLS